MIPTSPGWWWVQTGDGTEFIKYIHQDDEGWLWREDYGDDETTGPLGVDEAPPGGHWLGPVTSFHDVESLKAEVALLRQLESLKAEVEQLRQLLRDKESVPYDVDQAPHDAAYSLRDGWQVVEDVHPTTPTRYPIRGIEGPYYPRRSWEDYADWVFIVIGLVGGAAAILWC